MPTGIVAVTVFVTGLILDKELEPRLETQMFEPSNATNPGKRPTVTVEATTGTGTVVVVVLVVVTGGPSGIGAQPAITPAKATATPATTQRERATLDMGSLP
jgi:hypothetical protein